MNQTIVEFERLYQSKISKKDFEDIENFILKNSDDNASFLKLGSGGGGKYIQARNYVGVLQTKSGFTIEILPKIADKNSAEKSKEILIKMLKTLKNFPFKSSNLANLKTEKMPLLEIFISMFLRELGLLVKRGIKSDYITLEENLKFLKGKLNINEQIKKNSIRKERFFTAYQEFINDIEINQIIKTTLKFLYKISSNSKNQQRIREFLFVFDEVGECGDFKSFFQNHTPNRAIKHYDQTLLWCKTFLLCDSFSPNKGDDLAFALLFDMNRLFESYVGEFIKRRFTNVKLQCREKYLIENPRNFLLKPDILIKEQSAILDTKWKIVKESKDITQSDLYQLYAYGKKHECDNLYLVYPKIGDGKAMEFWYDKDMSLRVLYFDLEDDSLFLGKYLFDFRCGKSG